MTSINRCTTGRVRLAALVGAGFGLWLGGCQVPQPMSSAPINADPLAGTPDDLTIDLRILEVSKSPAARNDVAVHAGRVIVLPDGSLHAELDGPHLARTMPEEIRRLDRLQIARLWASLNELGLLNESSATPISNPMLIQKPDIGRRFVLLVRGNDRWWQVVRDVTDNGPEAEPALHRLAGQLWELAWLSDSTEQAALVAPRRYDFGSDPYARYRDEP